ncbi:DUF2490 domain-containing protein [Flavobacteriaceae bacterium]|nr:DUF2490 domain-containing protein [Flavobacteriaceae bacterium]
MLKYNLFILCSLIALSTKAQTDVGSWLIYKNKFKINSNTSIDMQYQHRSFDLDLAKDQALFTAGFSSALSSNVTFSAGYRKIAAINEDGAYQKLAFSTQLNKVRLTNTVFIEERWINKDLQLRYRFGLKATLPITQKLAVSISEEVFLQNAGSGFNQNRFTAQASNKLSNALTLNIGIMHWQFPTMKKRVFLAALAHNISL